MAYKYFMRFVGTNNTGDFAAAVADGGSKIIEIAVYSNEPNPQYEGDDVTYLSGVLEPATTLREGFQIECVPFSTYQAIDGTSVVQNSETLLHLRRLFTSAYKFVWLALPASPLIAPPRWTDATNFYDITVLLPVRVVRDGGFDASLNKELGVEEVTLNLKTREL